MKKNRKLSTWFLKFKRKFIPRYGNEALFTVIAKIPAGKKLL